LGKYPGGVAVSGNSGPAPAGREAEVVERHTYASLMLRRAKPIAYVSRQLGHSSIQVTVDLYGHFVPGGDRHHVEDLAQAIEAERSAAEARVLAEPEGDAAPDGTLRAPRTRRSERSRSVSD
jgi:hypothetical protein